MLCHEPMALRLQRLPSRNRPWQDTQMTEQVRTSLATSQEVSRTFWALYGLRVVAYRLLGEDGTVLASTLRGEMAPPAEEIYSVRVWAEIGNQPGSFLPRIDVKLASAVAQACDREDAAQRLDRTSLPRGTDGLPLSHQLLALDTRRRSASAWAIV